MILPESLLKNQEKIKTKNNKWRRKNEEQTVITEKTQAQIWKNMKKQEEKRRKKQEESRRNNIKKEETIRTEKKWGEKNTRKKRENKKVNFPQMQRIILV